MEHRDYGLKGSLSIGIKFSSPSCHHPVSSPPRLPLVTILSPLLLISLSSLSHACVLQWRDCGLKGSLSMFSSPSRHHPVSSPRLPLVTIPCVCPAMEHRDCGLKRSLSIGIKFSSPSRHHPVSSPLISLLSSSCPLSSRLPLVTILSPLLVSLSLPSHKLVW